MAEKLFVVLLAIYFLFGTVVKCSEKKGIGIPAYLFKCDDFKALSTIKWWYDWRSNGARLGKDHNCTDYDQYKLLHVPIAAKNDEWFPDRLNILEEAKYLLGFNEPNHQKQANITAKKAAELWPQVENLAIGKILVSPAAAPCGAGCNEDGSATAWFDAFFEHCVGCRNDYLATHIYKCEASQVMDYLQGLWERYNLEIWVTEFACPGENDPAKQLIFMKEVLPLLENAPYIKRYAWYMSRLTDPDGFVKPAVSLLEADASTLTELGRYYVGFAEATTTTTTTTTSTASSATSSTTSSNNTPASNTVSISEPAVKILRCYIILFSVLAIWYWVV